MICCSGLSLASNRQAMNMALDYSLTIVLELECPVQIAGVGDGFGHPAAQAVVFGGLHDCISVLRVGHLDQAVPGVVLVEEDAASDGSPTCRRTRRPRILQAVLPSAVCDGKNAMAQASAKGRLAMSWRFSKSLGWRGVGVALMMAAASVGCSEKQRVSPSMTQARWHFDGQRPTAHWQIAATNPTAALATWQVVEDPTSPSPPHAFALTNTENYDGTFNLAMVDGPAFQDLDLTVRIKAVAGEEDQGGGPIWRCQDENNYYIARFNPLESNFRVYVVANGRRRQLDSVKLELSVGRWYALRVRMVGSHITCYLDGKEKLTANDATITAPGRIGLWTKADAVTSFDDLAVTPITAASSAAK